MVGAHRRRRAPDGARRVPAAPRRAGRRDAAVVVRGRPDPAERDAADDAPRGQAAARSRSRARSSSAASSTIGAITVPKVNVASFVAGIVLLGLLTRVRDPDEPRAVDARGRRGPRGRPARWASRSTGSSRRRSRSAPRSRRSRGCCTRVQAGQINPYMGFTPVLKAFIAAVIGGFGSIAGAVRRRLRARLPRGPGDGAGRDRRPAARRAPFRPRSARSSRTGCRAGSRASATRSSSSS